MENTEALQVQVLQLEELNPRNLPEFQGWKEKQQKLVTDNPFIKITDNKSYDEAKKRRTALVTGRTTIQKQDQFIGSKIKDFRSKVSDLSKELIAISIPHEEKQQSEVKRFEEVKAKEKAEAERLEAERKEKIKVKIDEYYTQLKNEISTLTFEKSKTYQKHLDSVNNPMSKSELEEFELDYAEKKQLIDRLFTEKKEQLEIAEKQRIEAENLKKEREELEQKQKLENERLKKERDKFEKEQKLAKEKAEKESEKKRKEQEKIDAENKKKSDEIAQKESELQAEKDRLAKIEADRIAKEESDKKAKEDAERQAKLEQEKKARKKAEQLRLEAIKPDKEKISKFIESLQFTLETPDIKDEKLKDWLNQTLISQRLFKESMELELSKLS